MDKKELTIDELKKMENLIKVTESINSLYQKMINLELKGQRDTKEYQTLLDYLTIALDTENRLYNELLIDYDKVFLLVDYLDSEDEVINIDSIIEGYSNSKVPSRIMKSLLKEVVASEKFANSLIPNKYKQLIRLLNLNEAEELITKKILATIDLDMAFTRDISVVYLAMLEEFINNSDYEDYLDNLIKTKYDIIFINRDIEKEFIANGFRASKTPDLSSELCANISDIDYEVYDYLKNQIFSDIAIEQIEYLFSINDNDYKNENICEKALLRQCLLRAIFLILDDEIIDAINENVHNIIESDDYLEAFPEAKISEKNIINCFKKIKLDRGKIKVYS